MRSFMGIAGAILAFTLTGCGETVDEGPKEFKGTPLAPGVEQLLQNQGKAVKAGDHKKTPPAETTKPADAKPADAKPADSKAAEKKG
jgi:hypothetical protein